MKPALPHLVGAVLLLGAAGALGSQLANAAQVRAYDVHHVPRGDFARVAALGQRGLISDLYWLATVQYIGDPKADERGWEKLYPLVDLVTDLDPRHGYAYQTAGIVLSAAGRLDESDAILKKGMEKGPGWWSFPYYVSFNSWFYRGDYATGARYAEIAARTPGASANISHLALSLASKSGTPQDALDLLLELRRTVKDEVTAAKLDEQIQKAVLERDAQYLEKAVEAYRARTGLEPADLALLVGAGIIPSLPADPFGGHYVWDHEKQEVRSSATPFRFRLRERPRTPQFQFKGPKLPGTEPTR